MSTVAELLVKISGDSSDLRKEIAASQRQLKRGFGPDALELSSGAASLLAGLAAAAGVAGAAAVKMSADFAASKTAFTTLLGSADAAEKMLSDLATFAADTPFELPGLIKASQRLMAFQFAAEDIIPIMSAVGNAISLVGGGQEAIDGVVRALGQMQAKGKLSAEEMNQLAERGINGWKYVAEAMGVSTAEAMKMAEQGAIDSTTAINALVSGMQANFVGGMDAMSKTVPGLLSTIKDNAGMLLKELGDNLTTALDLQGLLTNVATFLTQFTSVVKSAGVKEAIQSLIPPEATAAVFALSGALVAAAIPAMYAFAVSTWAAIAPMAPFIAAGIAVGLLAYEIWNNWEPLCELFDALWSTVSQLFSDYWGIISDVVSTCWNYITDLIDGSVGWVLDAISAGWDAVVEVTSSVWSGVTDYMSSAWEGIKSIVTDGVQWVLSAMQPLLDLVSSVLPEGIKTMFSNLGAGIDRVKSSLSGFKLGGSGVETLIPEPNKPNTKFTGLHGSAASAAPAGAGGGGGGGGGKSAAEKEYEKLEKAAEQTSKRIQKEWMQLTGARIDALDSWRNDEIEKLNESASANENYERDLQRLNEIYSHKKIKILYDEEKERNSIFDSAYEAAKDLQERMSKLSLPMMTNSSGGMEPSKVAADLQSIDNEYTVAITKIQNKYRDLEGTYEAASAREQAIYRDAWAKNGIDFEIVEQGKVNFKKQIDKESVASEQEKDQKISAINVARKQWEEAQESARNAGNIAAFQATLSNEQALLAQDLAGRQAYIDEFYALWKATHKSSMSQMAESMGDFQSGMTDIFMNIGSEIKSAGDLFSSFGKLVLNTILKIQAQAAATSFTQSLFGNGGWLRGIFGGNGSGSTSSPIVSSVGSLAHDSWYVATGGFISGSGTATSDSIPAMLSNGEYVINAASVGAFGVGFFDSLNKGKLPHFATGGIVAGPSLGSLSGNYFNTSRPSASTAAPNVTVNVINNTGTQATATASQPRFDGKKYIIDVVMDAYNRNVGGMRTVMANGRG